MKRTLSIIFAFLLVCSLFSGSIHSYAVSVANKISDNLMSIYDELGNSSTLVYVEMRDIEESEILEEFSKRYPDEYALYSAVKSSDSGVNLSTEQEVLLDQALLHKRQIYKQYYSNSNSEILDRYFGEDAQLFVSSYAPVAVVESSETSTWAMARSSDILSIYAFTEADFSCDTLVSTDANSTEEITDEFIDNLVLANQISRADIVRDTYGLTGEGIKIGVVEAVGVPDTSNPYLRSANITINQANTVTDIHATKVTAIMAASDAAGDYGTVPDAEFFCCVGSTWTEFYTGVEWLLDCGVNVINASLGWNDTRGYYDSYSAWVDHIAVLHDVHFVKSAGNDIRSNPDYSVTSPGMAYNAITVGGFEANSDFVSSFTMYSKSCYVESAEGAPEKPNLVAKCDFDDANDKGTSYAAPQVTGVIAQLCDYYASLKTKQSAMGAILMASAAEKIESAGTGTKGDVFSPNAIAGSIQISDKEGAGILDALWARGIAANVNWLSLQVNEFPNTRTITINTSVNTVNRIAIFWLKRNVNYSHTGDATGENSAIADINLHVYDSNGNFVASSTAEHSNFEIVQFLPRDPGEYTVIISGSTDNFEHVGYALW